MAPLDTHPIELSSKTLVHISSGIYRSSANALKELVSNAFDAQATLVRINTNYPQFDVLTCYDNGTGMLRKDFETLMAGIGNSRKRIGEMETREITTERRRPIIGRIGIGMLAIAQICYEFTITSHHRESETAFEAVLNLRPPRRQEVSAAKLQKKYKIGSYTCTTIPFDSDQAGMRIATRDLLDTYTKRYRDDVNRKAIEDSFQTTKSLKSKARDQPAFVPVPLKFADLYAEFSRHRSVRALGEYWRLFWELSVATPIRYLDDGPIRPPAIAGALKHSDRTGVVEANQIIEKLRDQQKEFDFDLVLDNVSLRKPIQIPRARDKVEARLSSIRFNQKIRGSNLKFTGYIYSQNKAITARIVRYVRA